MTHHERTRVKNALSWRNTLECTRHREKTPVGIQDVWKNRVQEHNVQRKNTYEITLVGCTLTSAIVIHLGMPRVCVCVCVCVIAFECSKFAERRGVFRSSTNCEMTQYLMDNYAPAFSPNQDTPKTDFAHRITFNAGASSKSVPSRS